MNDNIPAENSTFVQNHDVGLFHEKISDKNLVNPPLYIDHQCDIGKFSAAGDQAKPEPVIEDGLSKLVDADNIEIGSECVLSYDGRDVHSIANSEGEEIFLEDHSPMDESELTEDEFDDVGLDNGNVNQKNKYGDPSSLVVIGRGLRLHTPPREVVNAKEGLRVSTEDDENSPNMETTTPPSSGEDIHFDSNSIDPFPATPPETKRSGSSRRPTLSPVIEEDVREYMQTWTSEADNDGEDDVGCGAGDATANLIETGLSGASSEEEYANEMSRVLSSAAVDAAIAEIDYEQGLQAKPRQMERVDELDDSCDDLVIILPEAHELNYDNVPAGSSLETSLQDAANARTQLDAQADFLENSLNCLEITLDRMSLNEAVMPDGSVVFLRDQLEKAKTGHLLRAWEKAKEYQDRYISSADLEKPLSQIQRELYQDQIKAFTSANEDMRTAVTQATLQEQALRGQARQVQQTYAGLEQNIASMTNDLVGLQARHHQLQNALMEERVAKEAAQRENERIYRRSSSDIIQPTTDYPRARESQRQYKRQSEWMSDKSVSVSSSEDLPPASPMMGPLPQQGGQRWWPQRNGSHREYDFIQPPPWRRGYRQPGRGRRYQFGQRPGWRTQRNWRGTEGPRPWERRRPPHSFRPFGSQQHIPPPQAPAPFTPPFKKETEVILTQFFHEMGRVENLLRERGFAKGPAADAPVIPYRPRPIRYQRGFPESHHEGWNGRRGGIGSRSMPSMGGGGGLPYRERSQRNTEWFDTSRSQTNNQISQRLSDEAVLSGPLQVAASA